MRNKIVILSGLPGSGKSTIAEAIAKKLAWPLFSVDPIESAILRGGLQRNFETGLAAYLVAETLAEEHLKLGLSVIIDAVNPVQESRDMWSQLSRKYQVSLFVIECILSPKIHKERIEVRVRGIHGIPEVTWEAVEEQRKNFIPWTEERLVLNTEQTGEIAITKILNYLQEF